MTGKDDSTANGEPEEVTMRDLFRLMNGMRTEIGEVRSEMNARFEQVDKRFDEQGAEIAAIRKTLDDDTATSTEVAELSDKIAMVQADVVTVKDLARQAVGQQRRLQSRLDRQGIPAE